MSFLKITNTIKVVMFVFGVIGMMTVGYGLGRYHQITQSIPQNEVSFSQNDVSQKGLGSGKSVKELFADTAASGDKLSFATGIIDTNLEGLFILDHLTGSLQCWVVNPKNGGVAGIYEANVGAVLASDKEGKADYVLATGIMDFSGMQRIGNLRPANCVVYVGEGNTGKVVGYSLYFNRSLMLSGRAQGGQLQQVCVGQTRGAVQRDQ